MKITLVVLYFLLVHLDNLIKCTFDNEINLQCNGKKFMNVSLAAYFPDFAEDEYLDKHGKKLRTLQDYLDNRNDFVTISMDEKLNIPYGTLVCIPELNIHYGHRIRFEVRDTSSELTGDGYSRADICVRTEVDSYDVSVNRLVTLIFVKD